MGVRLELAPLIDIIFILLIFFAVSSTLVIKHQGIKLQLPSAESTAKQKKGANISIDKNHRLYLDEKPISIDLVTNRIASLLKDNSDLKVLINADESAPYSLVITVLDRIRLGGCFNVALQAKKPSKNHAPQ